MRSPAAGDNERMRIPSWLKAVAIASLAAEATALAVVLWPAR